MNDIRMERYSCGTWELVIPQHENIACVTPDDVGSTTGPERRVLQISYTHERKDHLGLRISLV